MQYILMDARLNNNILQLRKHGSTTANEVGGYRQYVCYTSVEWGYAIIDEPRRSAAAGWDSGRRGANAYQ